MTSIARVVSCCSRRLIHGTATKEITRLHQICVSLRPVSLCLTQHRLYCLASEEEEKPKSRHPLFTVHDVATSIRYLNSEAFKETYQNKLVWEPYRRNHKGGLPPSKTRRTCIRGGHVTTGNPCPICRDEYLVVDKENVALLRQFVSPQTGQVLPTSRTGVCQKQHKKLLVEVQKAYDLGLLEMPLPLVEFDYTRYYPDWKTSRKPKPTW